MSYSYDVQERMTIRNGSPAAEAVIEKLIAYVNTLNYPDDIREPAASVVLTICDGMQALRFDRLRDIKAGLADGAPLSAMLSGLRNAREITFSMSFRMIGHNCFGSMYWPGILRELPCGDDVDWRLLEFDDFTEIVNALHYTGGRLIEPPRDEPIEHVADVPGWYATNALMTIDGIEEPRWTEFEERFGALHAEIVKGYKEYSFPELDIYEGCAEFRGSFNIRREELDGFIRDLQRYADLARDMGATFHLADEFVPAYTAKDKCCPYAVLHIEYIDGRIAASCCRYDD